MRQYFILINGESEGPYTADQLSDQRIHPETLVWFEGLKNWQKASTFPELVKNSVPASSAIIHDNSGWYKRMSFIVMALIILVLIGGMVLSQINQADKINESQAIEQAKADQMEYEKAYTREKISELVQVKNTDYMYRRIGGVSGLKVTISNSSQFDMDLVLVDVVYIKSNGGVHKTETLRFNNLKAHSTLTQHAPESNRGVKVECNIVDVKSNDLSL